MRKTSCPMTPELDLLPIANVTSLYLSATVSLALNAGSLRELVELLRANPGKFNWATREW